MLAGVAKNVVVFAMAMKVKAHLYFELFRIVLNSLFDLIDLRVENFRWLFPTAI